MNEYAIKNIHGREILDSRGNPTVEVDVTLENGMMARAEVLIVCAQKGIDANLVSPDIMPFCLVLILVSSFLTPICLKLLFKEKEIPPLEKQSPEKELSKESK